MTGRATLAMLAVVLGWVTLARPYANGPPIRSDGLGYHLWTYALLRGDLNFARYRETYSEADCFVPADPVRGFWHNKYAPGVALVRLPVMALLADRTSDVPAISPAEHWAALALGAAALLATGAVNLATCRRLGLPGWAGPTAFVAHTLGTGLFHFATYDAGFSHVYSALGLAVLLDRYVAGRVGWGTALTVVLLVLVRNTNVLAVAALSLGFFVHRRSWRELAVVVAAGVAGCGLQVALNSHAHGRLTLSSYGGERFLLDRPMTLSVLVSAKKGLFAYYPLLAVTLAAGLTSRRTRPATALYAGLLLACAAVFGCWHSWWLGGGFGHRGFVELVPLAVPLFAATIAAAGWVRRIVLLSLSAVCVVASLKLMAAYWRGDLPFEAVTPDLYWRALR